MTGTAMTALRADRRERLRIALVMIGSGVLDGGKREAGGRRSEDRGKGTVSREGAKVAKWGGTAVREERSTLNAQLSSKKPRTPR